MAVVVCYLLIVYLSVGKAPDPGDTFSVRTESASTVFQSTAEKRNQTQTPYNSVNGTSDVVKRKGESASSIKAKLDNKSGIDEQVKQECRQVLVRLRAVPLFSYSPSRAGQKKQAARKLAVRKLLSGRKAEKKGTTDKASAFDLRVAPTTQKCDWLMLDSSRQDKGNNWIAVN